MFCTFAKKLSGMKHPDEETRKKQIEYLNNCKPEERSYHEQMLRIGNAAYVYHSKANETDNVKLEIYYNDWLEELPPPIKEDMKELGFEGCKNVLPFTRYVNERNDEGLDEWMRENLSEEDYREYVGMDESPTL